MQRPELGTAVQMRACQSFLKWHSDGFCPALNTFFVDVQHFIGFFWLLLHNDLRKLQAMTLKSLIITAFL